MNPEFSSMSSSTIESIRKAGIGRRGGVKVRGGRLPPVKIHNVLSRKKTIAPKIPQKRTEVRKERVDKDSFDELPFREETKFREQRERGRGRGRGARVYIQTEGTLFDGDGMAFKSKLERNYSNYERSASKSRASVKVKERRNPEEIDHLFELYDDSEDESDIENDLKPIKYPCIKEKQEIKQEIKQEVKQEIKQEMKQEMKQEIKDEIDQNGKNFNFEDIKKFIKVEPVDDYENEEKPKSSISKFFTPIEAVTFSTENELVTDLKNLKSDKGMMLLIQFPSCFPFQKEGDNLKASEGKRQTPSTSKDKTKDEDHDEETRIKSSIRDIPEGFVGKLQFLKSGKMRLILGSTQLYLETASTRHVQASVASISVKGNEGEIIVLGNIDRKMLFRPHFRGITD